jgi:hypothetical protein
VEQAEEIERTADCSSTGNSGHPSVAGRALSPRKGEMDVTNHAGVVHFTAPLALRDFLSQIR